MPRVMEVVLISKVIPLFTRACMIYLSEAAQNLKTWITTVAKSNLILIKIYLEIFALEKKRDYILSMTLFINEVKKKADCKLIFVDLNSRKKVKQLQIIRTSESNESNPNEEEKHQCQYKINQQLRCGKFSTSEQIYITSSICSNSAELLEKCVVQKDCEDVRKLEAAWKYKHKIELLASKQSKKQLNQKDRESRSNALVSTIKEEETIPGKDYSESDKTQQLRIIHETQQASPISKSENRAELERAE